MLQGFICCGIECILDHLERIYPCHTACPNLCCSFVNMEGPPLCFVFAEILPCKPFSIQGHCVWNLRQKNVMPQ